ncbi:ATP-binding cassette domain-containing protein [Microbacterium excoecariae]|uniref:ATP-binding cassette domain-containing protein n=1 Tax=Microbacterium excoecariae TaxID=2715210 RepID=UPI00140B9646|nr:ATP-binding cassette domain-containing protein [Microbacterium excoecariae]NHI17047.1 ATP-binding cassette domain-containing protein [Microbacterium excoecariae]
MALPDLTDHALDLDDVSVARGRGGQAVRAVDGVSWRVPYGGALVVSGATGSGKSALAAAIAGRETRVTRIVGGAARVCGVNARRPGRSRSVWTYRVGYLAQDGGPALNRDLTVGESIVEPIVERDAHVDRRRLEQRVSRLLDEVRLPLGAAARYPHELSAGMRQRVALARALVLDPRLLVADEPLAGIDVEVRHVVRDAILARRAQWGMALLAVSNDDAFAEELSADRIVLEGGHVTAVQRSGSEPLATPGAASAAAFLSGEPRRAR